MNCHVTPTVVTSVNGKSDTFGDSTYQIIRVRTNVVTILCVIILKGKLKQVPQMCTISILFKNYKNHI